MKGEKTKGSAKMTEDKKSRAEIISREYADNIIRSMTESLIVVSPEGNIQTVNAATCALLGYEEKEMVGQPVGKIVAEEEEEEELRFKGSGIEDLIKKGSVRNIERAYLSKDGRKIPVLFSGSVMCDDDGKIQGIVCMAQDITERKRAEEQVRGLIRGTLNAQEAERERICLEVHDGVTQTMASAFQYLQTLESTLTEVTPAKQLVLRASALVKQAIQESREVINSLQPVTLRDLGLVATLRQEVRQLEQETGWKIDFKADTIRLPADIETGLYRIIHEAITNARKHADTNRLRLVISSADNRVTVEVRDWGIGFNYNPQNMLRRRGTGLLSMRKRAELLQGVCNIQSSPGQGTTVRVEIPLTSLRK
jgi:PAS domain S-box-containing protein